MVERRTVRDIVAQDEAIRAAEEVGGEGTEALLTRRVPELEAHRRALDLDHLVPVVYPDSRNEFGTKHILVKPKY
eukprot:CAMPEP_0194281290 /NCGR_PEP_ID=MMETSP0169-20130528/20439_1 /TAXON_ID=218684 /ORGANISM="Corethron pennatum, Strain L29A3" /LENGTH=74 /DNA_ID=CAMNT_0039026309 /DNA_START=554 /DNA_END=778 /DNA_ORIENTATION=+